MTIKRISIFIFAIVMIPLFLSCEVDDSPSLNYVTFEKTAFAIGVPLDETSTTDVKVFAGNTTGSDRTFNVVVNTDLSTANPQYYSVPATVTIPANSNVGILPVQVTGTELGDGKTIVLNLEQGGGAFVGRPITITVTEVCLQNVVTLSFTFDSYPEESAWELLDANDAVLASGGLNAAGTSIVGYPGQTGFETDFCLANGAYTLVIYDAFGDGFCCAYGNGSYTLALTTDSGEQVLATGGQFGAVETVPFNL